MDKKNKNKGFTLIEIIVTVAIMAIVTGATMSIYSWIKSNRLKSLAGNTDDAIGDLRSVTLAKSGKYRLVIYDNGSNIVADLQKETTAPSGAKTWKNMNETTTIGSKGSMWCVEKSSGNDLKITKESGDYKIILSFNKTDGSFSQIVCARNSDNVETDIKPEIHVSYGGKEKTVKLIELTGKHYIK